MSRAILRQEEARPGVPFTRFRVHLPLLIAAGLVTWLPTLQNDFVWIDHAEIVNGGYRISSWDDFASVWTKSLDAYLEREEGALEARGGYFRPAYAMNLSADWALWRARPALYHAENVLWHLLVVCLLYFLGCRLLNGFQHGSEIAFWSALLFSAHTLNVHSVTWISGRKDLVCAAFSLLCLLSFLRVAANRSAHPHRMRALIGSRWLAAVAAVMFLLLALLCKELAFVLPILTSLCLWYVATTKNKPGESSSVGAAVATLGVIWLCAIGMLLARYLILGAVGLGGSYPSASLITNLAISSGLWWHYVAKIFYPVHPSIVDRWPIAPEFGLWQAVGCAGLLLVLTICLIGVIKKSRAGFFGAWFMIWLLPASGLLPLRHLYAERYLYPASWGMAGLLAFVCFGIIWRRQNTSPWLPRTLLATCVIALIVFTTKENRLWKNDETLFAWAIEQDPAYVEGRIGLAALELERGNYAEAVEHSQLALASAGEEECASYWSPFIAHSNLGLALYNLQKYDAAQTHFERARDFRPNNAIAHYHLGLNAMALRDFPTAEEGFRTALARNPLDFLARSNLGYVLLIQNKLPECIDVLQPLAEADPHDLVNRANLGSAYLMSRRFAEAEVEFAAVVESRPGDAVHLAKLAWCEWQQQKTTSGLLHLQTAVKIDRNNPTVRNVALMVLQDEQRRNTPPEDKE